MRRSRLFAVLAALAAVLAVAPSSGPAEAGPETSAAPAAATAAAAAADGLQLGVQFHGTWDVYEANPADRGRVTQALADMGAGWVRIDISWAMLEPQEGVRDTARIDAAIQAAHAKGLNVLGTFWRTPQWASGSSDELKPPTNPKKYAKALAWAADHWKDEVQAWEVWNEPNSADFFRGANPQKYADLLCAAYQEVPRTTTKIVFGGTVYNDLAWIRQTYPTAKKCFDVMATHPYMSPADLAPTATSEKPIWDFRGIARVHDFLVDQGQDKNIWLTEFGWSSHANTASTPNWERGVTQQQQADYTVAALRLLRSDYPYVKRAFLYQERPLGDGVHQQGYGILDLVNQQVVVKPVYTALKAYLTS